ncbi:MAG: ABC transporter substrate-binding protein [Dehalococcoidia bacterium]
MAPKLKFLTGSNPRLEPLKDGTVKVDGYDLEFTEPPGGSFNLFQHNLHNDDFEVSEMSMSESMIVRDRKETYGNGRWNWAYIPNFLARGFNWDRICVKPGSDIKSIADLKGKRLAVGDYSMTAILWFRAMLKDLYGIEADDIDWYNLRNRGKETGLDKDPPKGVSITWLPQDADPAEMLENGTYDAVHGVNNAVISSGRAQPLFPSSETERLVIEHYHKNGSEHANHHYVIQQRILDENPGVALALYNAFEKSRQVAIERAGKESGVYRYFPDMSAETQDAIFGEPYSSGIKANRRTIQRLLDGAIEQGLIVKPITVEEFYPAEVQNT